MAIAALAVAGGLAIIRAFVNSESDSSTERADASLSHQARVRQNRQAERALRVSHREFVATNAVVSSKVRKPVISMSDVFYECRYADGALVNPRPIFRHSSENFIAEVLSETPGVRFLDVVLDENFDSDFLESLKTPIIIGPDDSEEARLIKQCVIESKKTIEKYMQDGLTPHEVVTDARDELNKIADYYDLLQDNYQKLIEEEDDISVVRRYVEESNRLLDEYGARHLNAPDSDETLREDMDDARRTRQEDLEQEALKREIKKEANNDHYE